MNCFSIDLKHLSLIILPYILLTQLLTGSGAAYINRPVSPGPGIINRDLGIISGLPAVEAILFRCVQTLVKLGFILLPAALADYSLSYDIAV